MDEVRGVFPEEIARINVTSLDRFWEGFFSKSTLSYREKWNPNVLRYLKKMHESGWKIHAKNVVIGPNQTCWPQLIYPGLLESLSGSLMTLEVHLLLKIDLVNTILKIKDLPWENLFEGIEKPKSIAFEVPRIAGVRKKTTTWTHSSVQKNQQPALQFTFASVVKQPHKNILGGAWPALPASKQTTKPIPPWPPVPASKKIVEKPPSLEIKSLIAPYKGRGYSMSFQGFRSYGVFRGDPPSAKNAHPFTVEELLDARIYLCKDGQFLIQKNKETFAYTPKIVHSSDEKKDLFHPCVNQIVISTKLRDESVLREILPYLNGMEFVRK